MTRAQRVANLTDEAARIEMYDKSETCRQLAGILAETLALLDCAQKRIARLEARERTAFMEGIPAIGETFLCALCQTVHDGSDPCARGAYRCAECGTKTNEDAFCPPCASKLICGPVAVR